MCVALVAKNCCDYPLVVVANRDEYYNRPNMPAHFWTDFPYILGGRDLRYGGTWMGVTTQGRFAVLHFIREPKPAPGYRSRGLIVSDFLRSDLSPREFITALRPERAQYPGFKILVGDCSQQLAYGSRSDTTQHLDDGCFGISSMPESFAHCHKVTLGTQLLRNACSARSIDPISLADIMLDQTQADDSCLLTDSQFGIEWERRASPIFARTEQVGTRVTTVIAFTADGRILFYERSFIRDSTEFTEVSHTFRMTN